MTATDLRKARRKRGWTQQQAGRRLGVSQPYLSLLERGERELNRRLRARAVQVYGMSPTLLPPDSSRARPPKLNQLARDLSSLGYPGFAYLRARKKRNPAEVLLGALKHDNLEARLVAALPWVLLHYPGLDWSWLEDQCRRHNLQNRLGFLVTLARLKLEEEGQSGTRVHRKLHEAEQDLEPSRLVREDAFGEAALTSGEVQWLRKHRSDAARHWNLLSDLRPSQLAYDE